jgi:uncharacterized protein YdaU (DUF1376 family)
MKEYFSHDLNARNDRKLIRLAMKHGMEGIGIYWCIIEMMYEEQGRIMRSECERIAFELRTSCEKIESVLQDFDLFYADAECWHSASVNKRIEAQIQVSNGAKKAAQTRWEKFRNQSVTEENATAMRTHTNRNANKEKKRKVKESKINNTETREMLPARIEKKQLFEVGEYGFFEPLVDSWISYKKSKGQSYKTKQTLDVFVKRLIELSDGDYGKAESIVNQSIGNNWAGIFELKNGAAPRSKFDTQKDEAMKALQMAANFNFNERFTNPE